MSLEIDQARAARPYSSSEYLGRILWSLCSPLFRFSPRPFFGWRRFLLRCFGAQIGAQTHIYPRVEIMIPWNLRIGAQTSVADGVLIYNLGMVTIGARSTVSHRAHLCAGSHDYCDPVLPLQRLPITIGDDAWICAQSFVGPDVEVGSGAVVGAGAVVTQDVPAWTVVAGNPASHIKERTLRGSTV